MAARGKGVERDRGWMRIKRNIKKLPPLRATVGVQGDKALEAREGGITNVELATTHEYGAPTSSIPQRSFIRSTFDEREKRYRKELDQIAKDKTLAPERVRGELRLLGEQYRADIINKIRSNIPPPLSPLTVERKKGETTALINTGQLLRSIDVQLSEERR